VYADVCVLQVCYPRNKPGLLHICGTSRHCYWPKHEKGSLSVCRLLPGLTLLLLQVLTLPTDGTSLEAVGN